MNNNELLSRIHDLEAIVNGLMIYIAAKEANVSLDPEDAKAKAFIKANVIRPFSIREKMYEKGLEPIALAADGFWDALPSGRIPELVEKLKES